MTDTLVFNKDGTYSQTVVYADGHTVRLKDKWKVENRGLVLQTFYLTFDIEKMRLIDPPIKGSFAILWNEKGMLVKEPYTKYIFCKESE